MLVNPNHPPPEELNPGVPAEILAMGIERTDGATRRSTVLEDERQSLDRLARRPRDLVALDEAKKVAYIKMSGGCQGCAMSRMTFSQGIETALREAIPELTDVRRRHRPRVGGESRSTPTHSRTERAPPRIWRMLRFLTAGESHGPSLTRHRRRTSGGIGDHAANRSVTNSLGVAWATDADLGCASSATSCV